MNRATRKLITFGAENWDKMDKLTIKLHKTGTLDDREVQWILTTRCRLRNLLQEANLLAHLVLDKHMKGNKMNY